MGNNKSTSKGKRTKKAAVKDLSPRESKAVKGGEVAVSELRIVKKNDTSSSNLFRS